MRLFSTISDLSASTAFALKACPLVLLLAAAGEWQQHAVEVFLGMFESTAAFNQLKTDPQRLISGGLKAAAVLTASAFIAEALLRGGSSALTRRAWPEVWQTFFNWRSQLAGFVWAALLAAPFFAVHLQLNIAAIGSNQIWLWLIADGLVVAAMALALGIAWAKVASVPAPAS